MWALRVVIIYPGRDQIAGMGEVAKRGLVKKLVPHATVETLDESILHGLSWRDVMPFDPVLGAPFRCADLRFRMAFEVSSVPLSETIMPGRPRRSISAASSRATRLPDIEVSGIAARHSRVTSSTMLSTRNRRPQANWS